MKVKEKVAKHKERHGISKSETGLKMSKMKKARDAAQNLLRKMKKKHLLTADKPSENGKRESAKSNETGNAVAESEVRKFKKKKVKISGFKVKEKVKGSAKNVKLVGAKTRGSAETEKNGVSKSEVQGVKQKRKKFKKKKKKMFSRRNKYLHLILPNSKRAADIVTAANSSATKEHPRDMNSSLETGVRKDASPVKKAKRKRRHSKKDLSEPTTEEVHNVQNHQKDTSNSAQQRESGTFSPKQKLKKKNKLHEAAGEAGTETERKKKRRRQKKKRPHEDDVDEPANVVPPRKKSKHLLNNEDSGTEKNGQVADDNPSDTQLTKKKKKKQNESDPSAIVEKSLTLKDRMMDKLSSSRFRYLNEQLYTMTGKEAFDFFYKDPFAFDIYHEGYKNQVAKWPMNPLKKVIKAIKSKPSSLVIADFGCGDATLARNVKNTVHSFDLVAVNEDVVACDMAQVPQKSTSIDIAVFCLSLMGTNIIDYIQEAHRVLKYGGTLKIAEVESRFRNVDQFIKAIEKLGFTLLSKDLDQSMFVFFDFEKTGQFHRNRVTKLKLNPCIYKKR